MISYIEEFIIFYKEQNAQIRMVIAKYITDKKICNSMNKTILGLLI